jgi:hypothetical protein
VGSVGSVSHLGRRFGAAQREVVLSRRRLMVAAAAVLAAVAPQVAGARPPVLFDVGHIANQPTARWSLPEGVTPFEICFEAVDAGSGRCWGSVYPTYFAPTSERLRKGTYNVYVLGHDSRCQSCPPYERSNSLTLVIPAVEPTLRSVRLFSLQRGALRGAATLGLCDSLGEGSTGIRVVIRQARLRQGRLLASRENTSSWTFEDEWGGGCGPLPVRWRIPPALARRGDTYRVTFSVVNIDGGRSGTMARQLRW